MTAASISRAACAAYVVRPVRAPDPLNDEEKLVGEHMHESQSYYGGLPAALLAERMDFLRPAVLAIWDNPGNQDHVRVLHKLLQYYMEMAQHVVSCRKHEREVLNTPIIVSCPLFAPL